MPLVAGICWARSCQRRFSDADSDTDTDTDADTDTDDDGLSDGDCRRPRGE